MTKTWMTTCGLALCLAMTHLAGAETSALTGLGIIPAPAKCQAATGSFELTAKTRIIFSNRAGAKEAANILQAGLKDRTGLDLSTAALRKEDRAGDTISGKRSIPAGRSSGVGLDAGRPAWFAPACAPATISHSPTTLMKAMTISRLLYPIHSTSSCPADHQQSLP